MKPTFSGLMVTCVLVACATTVVYYASQQSAIQYSKGHQLFRAGDYQHAIHTHEKNLEQNPSRLDVMRELARSYQWSKNYAKAVEIFRRILQVEPKDLDTKIALAETLSWNQEYPEAIRLCREVLAEQDTADTRKHVAEIYLWSKDYGSAESLLRDVLKNNPQDAQAQFLLAKTLQFAGRPEEAAVLFENLLNEGDDPFPLDKHTPSQQP